MLYKKSRAPLRRPAFKRLSGKGSELPGALPRRCPKCSLTYQKGTLDAHFGFVSWHCLGLTYPSQSVQLRGLTSLAGAANSGMKVYPFPDTHFKNDSKSVKSVGRNDRTRTCDLTVPNRALYHLSYIPPPRIDKQQYTMPPSSTQQQRNRQFIHARERQEGLHLLIFNRSRKSCRRFCAFLWTDKVLHYNGFSKIRTYFRLLVGRRHVCSGQRPRQNRYWRG